MEKEELISVSVIPISLGILKLKLSPGKFTTELGEFLDFEIFDSKKGFIYTLAKNKKAEANQNSHW